MYFPISPTQQAIDVSVLQTICIGDGWVAVATDKRQVRIFTVGGVQKEVFSLPGPAVTMAAFGSQLMVVYHSGLGMRLLNRHKQILELLGMYCIDEATLVKKYLINFLFLLILFFTVRRMTRDI